MSRLPAALFVVDIKAEHIAIKEAQKLNIPVFAMVDTNSDPREVEFVIPSNDDASKSIDKILSLVTAAIIDGLSNRGADADAQPEQPSEEAAPAAEAETKVVAADVEVVAPAVEAEVAEPAAEQAPETEA